MFKIEIHRWAVALASFAMIGAAIGAPQAYRYRPEPPPAVALPADVAKFVASLESAYASESINAIETHLSPDFLYQGMRKADYLRYLRHSLKRLKTVRLTVTRFDLRGDKAGISAYLTDAGGIVGAASMLAPVSGDAQLVRENGTWKLYGNQQLSSTGWHRHFVTVYGHFKPANPGAYQRQIPSGWSMPANPTVRVSQTEWLDVEEPYIPYRLISLSVLAQRNGEEHWVMVALPETDWLAVEAGKPLGFPKFVADIRIDRATSGEWSTVAMRAGQKFLSATYRPDAAAAEQFKPIEKPSVLQPPNAPPLLFSMGDSKEAGGYGWMTLKVPANTVWHELLGSDTRGAAIFREQKTEVPWTFRPVATSSAAVDLPADVQKSVAKIESAWRQNDIETVMGFYHANFKHDGRDKNAQRAHASQLMAQLRQWQWQITEFRREGSIAAVKANIINEAGSFPVSTAMIEEDGRWYFYGNQQ